MQDQTTLALATLIAILVGPIVAVFITRLLDHRSEKRRRRMMIFRDLMQTRGIRMDPVHVAALNLVELEFYQDKSVRQAFKNYIQHLASPMPGADMENKRHFERRSELFVELLFEIGKVLRYQFDKMDLDRNSYVPLGWDNDETLQRRNSQLLNTILSGQGALPVTNFIHNSPFPEPPQLDD